MSHIPTNRPTTLVAMLDTLNGYERKTGRPPVLVSSLLTLEQARERLEGIKTLDGWHADSLFLTVTAARDWLCSLTPKGFEDALRDERIGGWFEAQDEFSFNPATGEPTDDPEGEFCSTPCISADPSDFDEAELEGEVEDGLDYCSRGGLVFLYA